MAEADLTEVDLELFRRLVAQAAAHHDGHLTIYRFTTNWRVGFGTPFERADIYVAAEGRTFREAATKALGSEADRLNPR